MRIDAFNKISELYKAHNVKSTGKVRKTSGSDTFEISQTGRDYNVARQIIANTPDVREAKIQDIKKRMEAGTYHVRPEDLADKLIKKMEQE